MDAIKITENLKDAGLNEKQIQDFFNKSNDTKSQLCILSRHRRILLDIIHKYQKELDCLDFLVYEMKKM